MRQGRQGAGLGSEGPGIQTRDGHVRDPMGTEPHNLFPLGKFEFPTSP